jgi:hypothetical protein
MKFIFDELGAGVQTAAPPLYRKNSKALFE